ncbi:hypothetical protein M9H77_28006 [Catharanthus roseus]|uniref:Uncharacterized protein n=1 Tax=Catharanthus roseus TaxID=4058 RepID=A0ACC0AIE8_CATRO|nr:hypothetical protein M9H77_28006 [Catharanthus roseus]
MDTSIPLEQDKIFRSVESFQKRASPPDILIESAKHLNILQKIWSLINLLQSNIIAVSIEPVKLYRCLKGETYLIVLDDIWDSRAWKKLKVSFPNDDNGSRIMLISRIHRIHKVALEAKADCSLHELYPLSLEYSLELLQMKLSYKDGIPLNLIDIGRKIAGTCEGLPLAIVLVTGLLVKADGDFRFWKQIAENLKSHVIGEGCMDVFEMSYKHLPDY